MGPLTFHAYALCIILGVIVAIWLTDKRYQAAGGSPHVISDLAIWVVPGGVIGARIYHVISSPEYFFGSKGDPVDIFKIWEGLLIAQGIGRFGNWFNAELYGRPTDLPWALKLDDGLTYHPTFLYEAICNFALALLLIRLTGKYPAGSLFYLYVAGYCSYRFFIEGIRIDNAHIIGGLRLNQWVSLVIGGAGLTKFIRQIR